MKYNLLFTLLACTLLAASASAGTVKVPTKGTAVASVELPDGLTLIPDDGVKDFELFNAPDGHLFVAMKVIAMDKGFKAAVAAADKRMKEMSTVMDPAKQSTIKVAGGDAAELDYKGEVDGEKTAWTAVLVPLKDKAILLVTWTSTNHDKARTDAMRKIAGSVKAL